MSAADFLEERTLRTERRVRHPRFNAEGRLPLSVHLVRDESKPDCLDQIVKSEAGTQ